MAKRKFSANTYESDPLVTVVNHLARIVFGDVVIEMGVSVVPQSVLKKLCGIIKSRYTGCCGGGDVDYIKVAVEGNLVSFEEYCSNNL